MITISFPDDATTAQVLRDVMCTALEGGIGYWCVADEIERLKMPDGSFEYVAFDAYDTEEPDKLFGRVTLETLRIGMERIMNNSKLINSIDRRNVQDLAADHESTSYDCDTADCIVQIGLFGELVYG